MDSSLQAIADKFKKYKMESVGIFFLESMYPLRGTMFSMCDFIAPAFKAFNKEDNLSSFRELLETEEAYKEFLDNLED